MVDAEVDVSNGLPKFEIVGLGDAAVQESKERVRAALKNSGFEPPSGRVTVNLAPGHLKKVGPAFDLPIALGIMAASGQLGEFRAPNFVFLGELSLDGGLRRVAGALPVAIEAHKAGLGLVTPAGNLEETRLVSELVCLGFQTLAAVVEFIRFPDKRPIQPAVVPALPDSFVGDIDLSDVKGQSLARRALEIAAAGRHNLLLVGPPGAGKSMLARRLPTVMPKLTLEEALEVTAVYSVGDLLGQRSPLSRYPPFRSPHHSVSATALVGGCGLPRPGEVSLAHRGALFLDELGEFSRHTLEVMRQPLEDRKVVIARARAVVVFPADFALIAAMNPCPCGYLGDLVRACTCSSNHLKRYWSRISGPLLDRIDLFAEVPRLTPEQILAKERGEGSCIARERVVAARERQARRFMGQERLTCNGEMRSRRLQLHCKLDVSSEEIFAKAIGRLGLSARSCDRLLRVARTIADLAGAQTIGKEHLHEALQFRCLDMGALAQ